MLLIYNDNTNPYFNLAMEEYLLRSSTEDLFILYRNKPSVIVGRNQNTLSEVNLDYVDENSIPVVRRQSGGGAVFHDLGNINFTFISCNNNSFSDFKRFTQPIIDLLKTMGLDAEFSGRNDLLLDGKKFSGNAQYHYKNKVMHHGTLLFSSQISDLSNTLKVKSLKFKGKGVNSVKSRITNISEHLNVKMDILEFKDLIMNYMSSINPHNKLYSLSKDDIEQIEKLVDDKYRTWEWNFGNYPKYSFTNELKYPGGNIELNLEINRGIISKIKIFGDFFSNEDIETLEILLRGTKHNEDDLREVLSHIDINNYLLGADADILIAGILGAKQKVEAL